MASNYHVIVIPLTVIVVTSVLGYFIATYPAEAQPAEDEAFEVFQKIGCISCHNGTVARAWDDILQDLERVQTEYGGDIDAFARDVEYTLNPAIEFESWEDLMSLMAQNVGRTLDDPDVQLLDQFFRSYAGAVEVEQPPAEETPEETPETPPEEVEEEARGIPFGLALALTAAIVVLVVAALYMVTKR